MAKSVFYSVTWLLIAGVAMPASAARTPGSDTSPVLENLLACRTVNDATARVACYDTAVAALQAARDRKEVVVLDHAGVKQVKQTAFGFSGSKIKVFGGKDDEAEIKEISTTLSRVQPMPYGLYYYTLANGTLWRTVEEQSFPELKSGQPVTIKAGILGSYLAKVGKNMEVKVKRVR